MSLETVLGIKDEGQLWSGARSWEKMQDAFLCCVLLSGSWQQSSGVRDSPHCSSLPFPSNSEEKGQLKGIHAQHP